MRTYQEFRGRGSRAGRRRRRVRGTPLTPGAPDLPSEPPSAPGPVPPTRVWLDPHADWTSKLYERLLAKRIVMVSGVLDDDVASRLSAPLLTLDAEQEEPIRLELQNVRAELPATLTVMGILDVLRVPVHACVSGEIAVPPSACSPPARIGPGTRTPSSCSPSPGCISAAR